MTTASTVGVTPAYGRRGGCGVNTTVYVVPASENLGGRHSGPDEPIGEPKVQFTCGPIDPFHFCVPGAACYTGDPCRIGVIACESVNGSGLVETCTDSGPTPLGASCGPGEVCSPTGDCVPCLAGERCDAGVLSCATGAPVCIPDVDAAVADACPSDVALGHD